MEVLRDYKLHLIAFLVVIICELIGRQTIWIIAVYPMLYAMIFGGIISFPKLKVL